ncbi:MAG: hypothetical protein AB1473_04835 [Thermodesulfobacteriota bacterium]
MVNATPKPSFIISAELHAKIAKSGTRVMDDPGEVVQVRSRARAVTVQPRAETRYSLREIEPRKSTRLANFMRAIALL